MRLERPEAGARLEFRHRESEKSSGFLLLVTPNSPICPHFLDVEGSPTSPSPQALQAMTSLQKAV